MAQPATTDETAAAPVLFTVTRGTPSAEELAALGVVVAAVASGGGSEPSRPARSRWADLHRQMIHHPTPGARWIG